MDKYLKTLELDKILEMLAELTSNDETRRLALATASAGAAAGAGAGVVSTVSSSGSSSG